MLCRRLMSGRHVAHQLATHMSENQRIYLIRSRAIKDCIQAKKTRQLKWDPTAVPIYFTMCDKQGLLFSFFFFCSYSFPFQNFKPPQLYRYFFLSQNTVQLWSGL
jgi:hypothetical protein